MVPQQLVADRELAESRRLAPVGAGTGSEGPDGGEAIDDVARGVDGFKFSPTINATPPTIRIVTSGPVQRLSTVVASS